MEELVDSEVDGEKDSGESNVEMISASSLNPIADPVVYQLVRVEGDGRLVPATDDEVMEVEHLLEENKCELPSVEALRHTEGHVSIEVLSSKKSDLEGSEGPSISESTETNPRKLNARLEVMLQKVKQEERLRLSCESVNCSPKSMDVDGQPSDHPICSQACDDKLRPENTSLETVPPHSTGLNGSHNVQSGSVETCSESANGPVTSRSSASEISASSKPDFSIFKGEICLDNLSIRQLQETFRATFGRQTSVKDKLWLKRRIAMGLTNSCDVPTTSFLIKNNKIVLKNVEEEAACGVQSSMFGAGSLPVDHVIGSKDENCRDSPTSPTNQMEVQRVLSGERVGKPILEYGAKSENLIMEQTAAKRARKPTRRYIEEISEVEEIRECTGGSLSSVKDSGHGQSSPKSRTGSVCNIGPQAKTFVTRQDSLGGCGVQIPYVYRARRGRPRKNFMAFIMNVADAEREKRDTEISNSEEEQDPEHEKIDSSGDNSDDNAETVPTLKGGTRRKHHRAWTLSEVTKLVEGVSMYGAGRWSEIRRLAFSSYNYRTSVDLKDKWRNLLRASFAQEPTEKGIRNSRKHTSIPVPPPILLRVRELAETHSQAGIEFGPSKFAGQGGTLVQEKGSGFL